MKASCYKVQKIRARLKRNDKKICDRCGEEIIDFPEKAMKLPFFKVSSYSLGAFGLNCKDIHLCDKCNEKVAEFIFKDGSHSTLP